MGIADDIGSAVNSHLRALRYLNRKNVTCAAVAEALGLPEPIVQRALVEYKIAGAKLTTKSKAQCGPMSRIITLRSLGQ